MSTKSSSHPSFYEAAVEEGLYSYEGRLKRYLGWLFDNVDFAGKAVLDIGGGSGLFSLYAAWMGASRVVNLEPGLAGSRAVPDLHAGMVERLAIGGPETLPTAFQEFDPEEQFDLVLLHSSVNHLDEEACMRIHKDGEARATYERLFNRMAAMCGPGAGLVLADVTRHNFWPMAHLPNPLMRSIEWEKHQPPATWSRLLEKSGFVEPRVRWSTLNVLGRPGQLLLGNKMASFFLTGHFVLEMRRGENQLPMRGPA